MNLEERLRSIALTVSDGQLRSFGCECCRRLLPHFSMPILEELISMGEKRYVRTLEVQEIDELRIKSGQIYDSLYPGHGSASAEVLAIAATGEVAFTESSLNAAINSSEFAAQAIAVFAARTASDEENELVFESAYEIERSCQAEILRKYLQLPAD